MQCFSQSHTVCVYCTASRSSARRSSVSCPPTTKRYYSYSNKYSTQLNCIRTRIRYIRLYCAVVGEVCRVVLLHPAHVLRAVGRGHPDGLGEAHAAPRLLPVGMPSLSKTLPSLVTTTARGRSTECTLTRALPCARAQVPLLLGLQAFLFYVPSWFWKQLYWKSGALCA